LLSNFGVTSIPCNVRRRPALESIQMESIPSLNGTSDKACRDYRPTNLRAHIRRRPATKSREVIYLKTNASGLPIRVLSLLLCFCPLLPPFLHRRRRGLALGGCPRLVRRIAGQLAWIGFQQDGRRAEGVVAHRARSVEVEKAAGPFVAE